MDKRVKWPERNVRAAWQIQYTSLGSFASDEKIEVTEAADRVRLNRLRSQCMVAIKPSESEASQDALFLSAIVLKLVQRGTLPRLPGVLERALPADFKPLSISDAMQKVIVASLPIQTQPIEVDPSFAIDPALELPFWNGVNKANPETCKWLTPQASLEALAGKSTEQTRWVDFLYCSPFSLKTNAVIEIDGSQHASQKSVDIARDQSLKKTGLRVEGRNLSNEELIKRVANLPVVEERLDRVNTPELELSMFLPTGLARFVTAVALLIRNGDIEADSVLQIDLESDIELIKSSGKFVFEFIRSIEQLWNLRSLPNEVFVNETLVFTRPGHSPSQKPKTSRVQIKLEQHVPPHALLDITDLPTCVIRGAYLPVELNFIPPVLPRPRFLNPKTPDLDLLLRDLLVDIFGHEDFRPNQLDAVKAGLFGRDSIVLLPTGSGKSLIYQMVGLLQPGITLVVDPIVSLIDDQVRSLKNIGIERTFGMHSGMSLSTSDMDELQTSVAEGQAIFVFISPERLQTKRFRETLDSLTKSTYVNSAVLDEAHCISEWGHDFRTAYLNVAKNLRTLCGTEDFQPTLLALTGTASPAVLRDIQREIQFEGSKLEIIRPESHDRPNLHYLVKVAESGKEHQVLTETLIETLPELIQVGASELFETVGRDTKSGLIFTTNINGHFKDAVTVQKTVDGAIAESNAESNDSTIGSGKAAIYSSTAPKGHESGWNKTKQENARRFIDDEISVLVATKSFGMGIDKPNIRWTLHFGYPSSLEAFAQESGRSGRDNKDSYCILLTNPAKSDDTKKILDLTLETETRRKDYASPKFSNTDLAIHMYFHSNSFKGRYTEYARCIAVLQSLGPKAKDSVKLPDLRALANLHIDVPDSLLHNLRPSDINPADWNSSKESAEGAIYRLNAIGIIDDYLVNFGSRSFTLKLGPCTVESIDDALLNSMKRIAPGKSANVEFQLSSAPTDFNARVEHHLKIFIETLYDTIEPARIRAITEMQQLASSDLTGEQVKARLNAYLSNGPLATAIEEVAESAQLDVLESTTLLDTVETQDSDIWIGASARQLETYPDNPILLSARVVGEGWRVEPDFSIIENALIQAFSVLDQYKLDTDQASQLLNWLSSKFETQSADYLSPKYNALADAWETSGLPDGPIMKWENEILEKAMKDPAWIGQLSRIRQRRMKRTSTALAKELERLSS